MRNFSYTKSQLLVEETEKIEELRKKLLLSPLSPKDILYFRFSALVNRIYYSLLLAGVSITKKDVIKQLSPQGTRRLSEPEHEIVRYKKALDYLYHDWLVSTKAVSAPAAIHLFGIASNKRIQVNNEDLQNSLRYVQANPDNPLIQSALSEILILTSAFFGAESPKMAHLTGLLFLYKYGYDFRRMLVLEEYFFQHRDRYNSLITQSLRDPNVTPWLEFVIEATSEQLNSLLRQLSSKEYESDIPESFLDLNERQRTILTLLEGPGSKIQNRTVQKQFKTSAITAARDLAKLTSLGLLYPVGKGRSTYYTKV